jgi:hypothetical protein
MPEEFTPEERAILAESPADTTYILDDDAGADAPSQFGFRFSALYRIAALPFGITPATTAVELTGDELMVRFGPWRVKTTMSNVTDAQITGPFSVPKTIGPAHLSFADRGLTLATNPDKGVCMLFEEPVSGLDPFGRLRHPGLTVTVAECERLLDAIHASKAV